MNGAATMLPNLKTPLVHSPLSKILIPLLKTRHQSSNQQTLSNFKNQRTPSSSSSLALSLSLVIAAVLNQVHPSSFFSSRLALKFVAHAITIN